MSLGSLILLVLIVGDISTDEFKCDPKYSKLTSNHTMCIDPKSNAACQMYESGVSNEDKELILQLHNEIRSKAATGKDGLPVASDMLQMVWDDELAQIAQKHVETCTYEHDCNECRSLEHFQVGQNIGILYSNETFYARDWKRFINSLYDEKESFSKYKNLTESYLQGPKDQKNQYGHYSQIIWAETWRIGCGWVFYSSERGNTSYFGCNYGPAGNVIDHKIYKHGSPCCSCPRNTCCGKCCVDFNITSKYEGLCQVVNEELRPAGIGEHDSEVLFICDNYGQADCDNETSGSVTDWKLFKSINGNWIRIELKGGQNTHMTMETPFKNTSPDFCYKMELRSAAVTEGQPANLEGFYTFTAKDGKQVQGKFQSPGNRQEFVMYFIDASMPVNSEITSALTFEVGPDAPPQFIDIKEISATRGKCPKY